ncbi:hypothetical protein [Rhizorhabdus argentea]|uniref:hypothetical protein n=1 Tax=Rhizorhabdus argentea TaxID=1387174 RepID=UPI0030EDEF37
MSKVTEADTLVRALIIALLRNGSVSEDELMNAAEALAAPASRTPSTENFSGHTLSPFDDLGIELARKLQGMRGA